MSRRRPIKRENYSVRFEGGDEDGFSRRNWYFWRTFNFTVRMCRVYTSGKKDAHKGRAYGPSVITYSAVGKVFPSANYLLLRYCQTDFSVSFAEEFYGNSAETFHGLLPVNRHVLLYERRFLQFRQKLFPFRLKANKTLDPGSRLHPPTVISGFLASP